MRALLQRVSSASVQHKQTLQKHEISHGMVVLLGIAQNDTQEELEYLVKKLLNLRIFSDSADKMNLSILQTKGEILSVSQFTLYGDTRKGNRPSFSDAAPANLAEALYNHFNEELRVRLGKERIKTGFFAADMEVQITNDGPVTFLLESHAKREKILSK
ncbi:MAG: D-aminoacyl-tRNA deacylase [Spirochaetota bacterium]